MLLLSHPTHPGTCPFGGSSLGHLVEWGLPAVCAWCVRLSDPPCHVMIIIYHHHTYIITHDTATSATDYRIQRSTHGGPLCLSQSAPPFLLIIFLRAEKRDGDTGAPAPSRSCTALKLCRRSRASAGAKTFSRSMRTLLACASAHEQTGAWSCPTVRRRASLSRVKLRSLVAG